MAFHIKKQTFHLFVIYNPSLKSLFVRLKQRLNRDAFSKVAVEPARIICVWFLPSCGLVLIAFTCNLVQVPVVI